MVLLWLKVLLKFNNLLDLPLIADRVTIGTDTTLTYVPLRDTFDTYTSDSWTYDGR